MRIQPGGTQKSLPGLGMEACRISCWNSFRQGTTDYSAEGGRGGGRRTALGILCGAIGTLPPGGLSDEMARCRFRAPRVPLLGLLRRRVGQGCQEVYNSSDSDLLWHLAAEIGCSVTRRIFSVCSAGC